MNPNRRHKLNNNLRIDYKRILNKEQYAAVSNINGAMLVQAAAGTGKTRTLTHKVAYMIENGIKPKNILLLTFTNNAATEMLNRVRSLLNSDNNIEQINSGTFHSFANTIIREYYNYFNISKYFTVLDETTAKETIQLVIKQLNTTSKTPPVNSLNKIFSLSKRNRVDVETIVKENYSVYTDVVNEIKKIYKENEAYKKKNHQLGFDDLLTCLLEKLENNSTFRNTLQDRFKYILVDEYQDTNLIQNQIIEILSSKYKNITVVGDPAQCIYSFNGANSENMMNFYHEHPFCTMILLLRNYRSSNLIIDFIRDFLYFSTQTVIGLYSNIKGTYIPAILKCRNNTTEANCIIEKIREIAKNDPDFKHSDVAVLFRDGYHCYTLEQELNKQNIDYRILKGNKFIEKKHIKDIIAYLKLLLNSHDFIAWDRVLMSIPKLGKVRVDTVISSIQKEGILKPDLFKECNFYQGLDKLNMFFTELKKSSSNVNNALQAILDHYKYINNSKLDDDEFQKKLKDIETLLCFAEKYYEIHDFLNDFSLDARELLTRPASKDVLNLSTVHGAKGLEWKYVFVMRLTEGSFPKSKRTTKEEVEEEKRIFYVASSRAKNRLFFTVPQSIMMSDKANKKKFIPAKLSSFFDNIAKSKYITSNHYSNKQWRKY